MAAYEASIFQTMEQAQEQIHNAFLEAVAQELHKPGGILSSIFHPLHLVEPGASFFVKLLDDENDRFSGWLASYSKKVFSHFNRILSEKRGLSKKKTLSDNITPSDDITPSDFEEFMHLSNRDNIIDYIVKDATRRFIATYAVEEALASTIQTKKAVATRCIESFCNLFQLDAETFKNYINLSRLFAKKLSSNLSSSSQEVQITDDLLENFEKCKKIIQPIMENDSDKIAEMQNYVEVIEAVNAMRTLQSIQKYESMVAELTKKFGLDLSQARRIIAICGYGLTKPYIPMITLEEYQQFSAKEENLFSQIRHEVYYRVADKEIAEFQCEPHIPLLMQIKMHMDCIITVIELASYDSNFFNGEKINYTFKVQSKTQTQEKYIPPLLYQYRAELQNFISAIDLEKDPAPDLKKLNDIIVHFKIRLSDDSIHSKWHYQFLTQLDNMVNSFLKEDKESERRLSSKGEPSASSQSPYSISSFHVERQRNDAASASSTGTIQHDAGNSVRYSHLS